MDTVLTLKDLFLILIAIGVLILIGYLISLVKNTIVTVKHTNKILEDVEVVSGFASGKVNDVEGIITKVVSAVKGIVMKKAGLEDEEKDDQGKNKDEVARAESEE